MCYYDHVMAHCLPLDGSDCVPIAEVYLQECTRTHAHKHTQTVSKTNMNNFAYTHTISITNRNHFAYMHCMSF